MSESRRWGRSDLSVCVLVLLFVRFHSCDFVLVSALCVCPVSPYNTYTIWLIDWKTVCNQFSCFCSWKNSCDRLMEHRTDWTLRQNNLSSPHGQILSFHSTDLVSLQDQSPSQPLRIYIASFVHVYHTSPPSLPPSLPISTSLPPYLYLPTSTSLSLPPYLYLTSILPSSFFLPYPGTIREQMGYVPEAVERQLLQLLKFLVQSWPIHSIYSYINLSWSSRLLHVCGEMLSNMNWCDGNSWFMMVFLDSKCVLSAPADTWRLRRGTS